MTRDEVTAIRLYFARNVDRYIERRRVMIRASRRLRESLEDIMDVNNNGNRAASSRQRLNTGESTNSLLDEDEDANPSTAANDGSGGDVEGGNNNRNNTVEEDEDPDERFARRVRAIARAEGEWLIVRSANSNLR